MFSEFESMFKGKGSIQDKIMPTHDYSKTPQRFNIKGRQIQQKKLLSEGAFGFIWLAQDIHSKEEFALKRVICMTQESFRAAELQKNIYEQLPESEQIVGYYGGLTFRHEGRTVVVTLMELCSKGNLFDLLQKMQGKGLQESMLLQIARSVLQGLIVLHKSGFIHRDIKIQNVLLNKSNKMKICDFGSCTKEIVDFSIIPQSDYELSQQKIFSFTTPMYRPPQIVDPYLKYKVTEKADLWMLGCVLYTMCYFVHPFVESNSVGIAGGVFRFPDYPSETSYKISQKMKDFIRNLLTPNPEFRPSAQKMLQIVQKWDSFDSIPLNAEAKKLKAQHLRKQEQLKKLNKKVVEHDGDIPIQELMKLQQKLKGKTIEEEQSKTFITNKETMNIVAGNKKSLIDKCRDQNKISIINKNPKKEVPPVKQNKAVVDFDSWGSFSNAQQKSTKSNVSNSSFNDFESFTDNKPKKQPIKSNSNDFMEFFATTSSNQPHQPSTSMKQQKKVSQVNLLDL